jgi:hypothetical protein
VQSIGRPNQEATLLSLAAHFRARAALDGPPPVGCQGHPACALPTRARERDRPRSRSRSPRGCVASSRVRVSA